jgi:hypothetical protein
VHLPQQAATTTKADIFMTILSIHDSLLIGIDFVNVHGRKFLGWQDNPQFSCFNRRESELQSG